MRTLLTLTLTMTVAAIAGTVGYDATLGTLPEAQGFACSPVVPCYPGPPQATVSGGALHQGGPGTTPTPSSGVQFWSKSGLGLDFNAGQSVLLEARLRVNGSNPSLPSDPERFRSGDQIEVEDVNGYGVSMDFTTTEVIVSGYFDSTLGDTKRFALDTTKGFHTYSLLAGGNLVQFSVDGTLLGSLPLQKFTPDTFYPNSLYFGDDTNYAGNNSDLIFARATTIDAASTPEPSTAWLLLSGGGLTLAGALRRRRQSRH